jgi:hypothetical protein
MLHAILIILVILVVVAVIVVAAVAFMLKKFPPGEQPPLIGVTGWLLSKMMGFAKGVMHLIGL